MYPIEAVIVIGAIAGLVFALLPWPKTLSEDYQ
jgi:hypothetical protein